MDYRSMTRCGFCKFHPSGKFCLEGSCGGEDSTYGVKKIQWSHLCDPVETGNTKIRNRSVNRSG